MTDRTLNKIYAQLSLRTTELSKLLRNVEIGEPDIHPIDPDDFNGDMAEIARIVRTSFQLPHGPIKNLVEVIENAGGIIMLFDFGTNAIDAISRWPPGMPPVFFINRCNPMDRIRFTLCHELGHIIMHHRVEHDSERQADEFAAEFLMPKKEIRTQLSDLSLQKLAILKQFWRTSMAALLKRSSDLNQVTPRHARTLWTQFGKLGYRTREPTEIDAPFENPRILSQILDVHLDDLGYSVNELSKVLCLSEREVRDIYIEPRESTRKQMRITLKEEKKAAIKDVEDMLRKNKGNNG